MTYLEDDTVTCDECGKSTTSRYDTPNGWFSIHAERGYEDYASEETGTFCSPACVKAWLEKWEA